MHIDGMLASADEYMKLATQQTLRVKELEKCNKKLVEEIGVLTKERDEYRYLIDFANAYVSTYTQPMKELEKENAKLKEKLAKFQSLLNGDYL